MYPFTAIVGQEEMKLALILNVIDPKIGGVMVMGDRGTGKSTTIRALADLLPMMPVRGDVCAEAHAVCLHACMHGGCCPAPMHTWWTNWQGS